MTKFRLHQISKSMKSTSTTFTPMFFIKMQKSTIYIKKVRKSTIFISNLKFLSTNLHLKQVSSLQSMPFKGLKSDGTVYANFCPLNYNLQAKFVPKPPQFSLQIHSFGPSFIFENSCPQTPLLMRGHQNYTPICYNFL